MKKVLTVVVGFLGAIGTHAVQPSHAGTPPESLKRVVEDMTLYVLADGDQFASSYLGDALPPLNDVRFRDVLQVRHQGRINEHRASNSVVGTPEVMDIGPNNRFAAIVETVGNRTQRSGHLKDLPPGSTLQWIDLSNGRPQQTVELGYQPASVDIHPKGHLLAVSGSQDGLGWLSVIRVNNNRLSDPVTIRVSKLTQELTKPTTLSLVQWHPTQDILAAHAYQNDAVLFVHASDTLKLVGTPVEVGPDPFVGRFAAGGRLYVTANWGRNFAAKSVYERLPKKHSTMSLIVFSLGGSHRVVQTLQTPPSPEGIAVSPDGTRVALLSMQHTLYALKKREYSPLSALSIYRVDGETLVPTSTTTYEAILPEGVSFGANGQYVFATTFAAPGGGGGIDVFGSECDTFAHLGRIPTPPGTHHVIVR